MKKKLLALVFLFQILNSYSQTPDQVWTKDARNGVYNDILNEITVYKNLTEEQKQSIGLCCLNKITDDYKMSEYQAKIDVELKNIKSSAISLCAKSIGVALGSTTTTTTKTDSITWTKDGKTVLYNSALAGYTKYEMTQQQRENLSLCYADKISKTYSKAQLDAMLDAEVKKIKNDAFKKCAEENSITLKLLETKISPDKKSLQGCWQSYDFTYCFYSTGDLDKVKDKGLVKTSSGKWFLEGDKLIIVLKDVKQEYKIIFFDGNTMKITDDVTSTEYDMTKFSKGF